MIIYSANEILTRQNESFSLKSEYTYEYCNEASERLSSKPHCPIYVYIYAYGRTFFWKNVFCSPLKAKHFEFLHEPFKNGADIQNQIQHEWPNWHYQLAGLYILQ